MLKNITIFIIGTVVGAGTLISVNMAMVNISKVNQESPKLGTVSQQAQESQKALGSQDSIKQKEAEEKLEKLRTQLFQEGIDISATVDKVFPGTGFILEDNVGVKIFTHWTKTAPKEGQAVSVKGTISRFSSEEIKEFKKESGFTPELENFLKDQKIVIEAQEVNLP